MHRYRSHTCGALRDGRYRPDRPPVRLVPPHPRPWRRAVHRPARPLRHDAMRRRSGFAGLQGGREAALRMGGADRRARCASVPPGTENPELPTGAVEVFVTEHRGARPGRRTAAAGLRRPRISRGDAAQVPLPRPAPREAAPEHHEARRDHRFAAPADEGAGLLRVPDADPDRLVARRARATTWCRRACIPASSTRCRRRRSSSSS